MRLFQHPISGHSHRVRLFLGLAGIAADEVTIDLRMGEHKQPEFLEINRFGQLPVLDDDGVIIADSNAILIYLCRKFELEEWLPSDPLGAARVQRWLSIAAGPIAFGPAAARLVTIFKARFDPDEVIARAHGILRLIDAELGERTWIALDRPTIADVALYSYVDRALEGNVDLTDYANVLSWLDRIRALPGFVPFDTTPVGLEAPNA